MNLTSLRQHQLQYRLLHHQWQLEQSTGDTKFVGSNLALLKISIEGNKRFIVIL